MVDREILKASIIGEAEKFIQQWDDNEIELKDEARKWTHVIKRSRFSKQASSVPDYIGTIIATYKKIRTDALFAMESSGEMKRWVTARALADVKEAAELLIDIKTFMETNKCFKPGEAYFKKMQTLQDQLNQEKAAKQNAVERAEAAEKRAIKAEADAANAFQEAVQVNDNFNRLTSKIRREMKAVGERFIEDALMESPDMITSETEEIGDTKDE